MTAKYEATSGYYDLRPGGFYTSPNDFQITHVSNGGAADPSPQAGKRFGHAQYPASGTTVPGLAFPPPRHGAILIAEDKWHFHWEDGDGKATKRYTCSGYK